MRYTVISWELMEVEWVKGGRACLAASQREGLIGKRRHKEEVQQEIIQDREKVWKTRQIAIFQMATNKKGANVISLAMVDLSMSQAEVNVARTHCKMSLFCLFEARFKVLQLYLVKSAMLYTA